MENVNTIQDKMVKIIPYFAMLISFLMLIIWKSYEKRALENAVSENSINSYYEIVPSPEKKAKVDLLQKLAMAEREKIKVMVEHDNSPLTKTYPMILDATNSFDPDVGDEIQYVWKQLSGKVVEIKPNPFSGKVSFEAEAGEYTFELTVSDDYGSEASITRTVIIEPEPNMPPIIDIEVRQGSELN